MKAIDDRRELGPQEILVREHQLEELVPLGQRPRHHAGPRLRR
jgi:hypothetical protein